MVYVHIDNYFVDDDFPDNEESNFSYKVSRPVNNVELMNLKHVRLPILPTVLEGWNDSVYFNTATDGNLAITLVQGFYTPDELVAQLNSQMTAAATGTFNSTYNPNTNKITLVCSENAVFKSFAQVVEVAGVAEEIIFERFGRLVGFTGTAQTASTSVALLNVVFMTSVRYLTLIIEVNGFQNLETINRQASYSFTIPNNSTELQGNIIYKEEEFSQYNHINHVNVNRLQVRTYLEDDRSTTNFLVGLYFEYLLEFIQSKKYAYVGRSSR